MELEASGKHSERSTLINSSISNNSTSYLNSNQEILRRSVGYPQLFSYVVGILIGSGVYVSPGLVAKYSSNMGTALIIWTISGFICLFGALCFCELAISLKKTGACYIYIKETFGDLAGFMTMWTIVLIVNPAGLSVVAVAIGEHAVGAVTDITSSAGAWLVKGVAVLCLLVAFSINIVSTSFTNKTQGFFSLLQILGLLFFICVGVWKVSTGGLENYSLMFTSNRSIDFTAVSVAFYSALWSYDGWGIIPSISEEMTNLRRDLWLAIVTGIPFVIFCYILVNLAFLAALSHTEIASSPIVASNFIAKSLGPKAALIVPIIVAVTCFGCLNATCFFTSRNILSAAREGHLPEPLCYIHKEKRTPVVALIVLFLLCLVWVLSLGSGTGALITYFSFAVWVIYGLSLSAIIVLRIRQPDLPRPFKVWIINPIIMCIISVYLVVAPFFKSPIECSICLVTLLLSIPVYFVTVRGVGCLPPSLKMFKELVYNFILQKLNLALCVYMEEDK